jgi:Dullard-like phosphatase family protein
MKFSVKHIQCSIKDFNLKERKHSMSKELLKKDIAEKMCLNQKVKKVKPVMERKYSIKVSDTMRTPKTLTRYNSVVNKPDISYTRRIIRGSTKSLPRHSSTKKHIKETCKTTLNSPQASKKFKIKKTIKVKSQSPIQILPPKSANSPPYTLILDLDETLIHSSPSSPLQIRPYVSHLLTSLSSHYELIIFTASVQSYADPIISKIDPLGLISHRLYRPHTQLTDNVYLKDLKNMGRQLERVVIVDNMEENFVRQKKNGIRIRDWYGDDHDRRLLKLATMLKQIAKVGANDLREELELYQGYIQKHIQ